MSDGGRVCTATREQISMSLRDASYAESIADGECLSVRSRLDTPEPSMVNSNLSLGVGFYLPHHPLGITGSVAGVT